MSKEDLSLSLCLPTAGSVHYKIVVDCAKKGISYTFIDYDQKKWIMLYISRIVFPCFLALVCITCVWVCVSAWAKERVRDRVKRDFSKRGARGQEAVNFRLTFAPYVRHTYVTSTSVCVCVWVTACPCVGVRKMEGKTICWTLELHYFPSSHKALSLLLPHFLCWQIPKRNKEEMEWKKRERASWRERGEERERQQRSGEERQTASMKDSLW